jgi:hypothetical protein
LTWHLRIAESHALPNTAHTAESAVAILPQRIPFYKATTLKLLLLLEEHAEADDGAVNEKPTHHRHNHGTDFDEARVREDDR